MTGWVDQKAREFMKGVHVSTPDDEAIELYEQIIKELGSSDV